jgi:sugar/nucleoside kinase (ribokinase family)
VTATHPIVLVVGDLVADVTIAPSEEPVPGEEIEGAISLQGGGSAANQAAWLAHFGAHVRFGGRVGDDLLGALLSQQLRDSGVQCRIVVDPHRSTGIVAAFLNDEGERALVTHRAANAHLRADDVAPELWDGAQLLILTGYLFTHPRAAEAGRALMALARERNVPVALDPASHRLIERYPGARRFLDWTAGAAWFLPNSSEAQHLTGATSERVAAAMLLELYDGVAITRGANGCLIATKIQGRTTIVEIPSPHRVVPVDSTGAGDAFAAGFLFAWLRGEATAEAATSGLRLAEHAVLQLGARPTPP